MVVVGLVVVVVLVVVLVGVVAGVVVLVFVRLTNCACGWVRPLVAWPVPSVAITFVIRNGLGRNTACPSASEPVASMPSLRWSFSSAYAVSELKWSEVGSSCWRVAYPSAIRSVFSCLTSGPVSPSDNVR